MAIKDTLSKIGNKVKGAFQRPAEGDIQPTGETVIDDGANRDEGADTIGIEEIRNATEILKEYIEGKKSVDDRIIANEKFYRLQHWEESGERSRNAGDPEPTSAWLFHVIASKHADVMDNFPEPNVFPREANDKAAAESLSQVLPVVLEQNGFEQVFSDATWYKLKTGASVYGVFWDNDKLGGLGDVAIRKIEILNFFWEPGVVDLQRSANVFHTELWDNKRLETYFPEMEGKTGEKIDTKDYTRDDQTNDNEKTTVIDWYYKKFIGGKEVVHYVKYAGETLLYASENDPNYRDTGFYNHGRYPFVVDVLFPIETSLVGFGYVDVVKNPQVYIDKLNQAILKNAIVSAKPRFFISQNAGVNEQEFADTQKDFVHVTGTLSGISDSIKQIEVQPISGNVISVLDRKIDELKETAGNRDVTQGGTSSGVTAASAIAALQEAGSKMSRDGNKAAYRAYTQVCYLVLELIRQFYTEPRSFRITGETGEMEFAEFSNEDITAAPQGEIAGEDMGLREPIFDIEVVPQKASPFSKISQNELALQLYSAGFFNPELASQSLSCLAMMDFDGKSEVVKQVTETSALYRQLEALTLQIQNQQAQMMQMSMIIDSTQGTNLTGELAEEMTNPAEGAQETMEEPMPNSTPQPRAGSQATQARQVAADVTSPR